MAVRDLLAYTRDQREHQEYAPKDWPRTPANSGSDAEGVADTRPGNLSRQRNTPMTTVHINLPDELAQKAASAGLLSAEAMEAMLREQLRRRAGEALQSTWQRGPQEPLTPEIEQEIVEEVRKVRAERRLHGAS